MKYLYERKKFLSNLLTALSKNKQYDLEEDTIIKFVLPLFEILGWDQLSKDMEFEYPVDKKNVKRSERKNLKYNLRLKYAVEQLKYF